METQPGSRKQGQRAPLAKSRTYGEKELLSILRRRLDVFVHWGARTCGYHGSNAPGRAGDSALNWKVVFKEQNDKGLDVCYPLDGVDLVPTRLHDHKVRWWMV